MITSGDQFNVFENTQFVTALSVTDVEQRVADIVLSIDSTLDGAFFVIDANNELRFSTAPDFELPLDANADNLYEVLVVADDGFSTTQQLIQVSIVDVDEIQPTVNIVDVAPDPRNTSVGLVTIEFSESVTGVDIDDFSLTRDGQVVNISGLQLNVISDSEFTIDLTSVTQQSGDSVSYTHLTLPTTPYV